MHKCTIFILKYVGYVKDASFAVASFKKVMRSAVQLT